MQYLQEGFEIIDDFVTEKEVLELISAVESFDIPARRGGIRNIEKKSAFINEFCKSESLISKVINYLGQNPILVRAIYFDKTPEQNWLVTWHQDKTVAVSERFERKGWHSWTLKDNINHAQPPLEVLNSIVTIRLHLDCANEENGCLKVIPKSHCHGILGQERINLVASSQKGVCCNINRGGALVMRPHILHSSSKALKPTRRRVIHLEFTNYKLPNGVKWAANM